MRLIGAETHIPDVALTLVFRGEAFSGKRHLQVIYMIRFVFNSAFKGS
jgi:hypothetical protein